MQNLKIFLNDAVAILLPIITIKIIAKVIVNLNFIIIYIEVINFAIYNVIEVSIIIFINIAVEIINMVIIVNYHKIIIMVTIILHLNYKNLNSWVFTDFQINCAKVKIIYY